MMNLRNKNLVPPGKFSFTVPETGIRFECFSLEELFKKIRNHYLGNNLELPEDWKARIEDHLCRKLPPEYCNNSAGLSSPCSMTASDIMTGMAAMVDLVSTHLKGGEIYVSQEEANTRAEICARCNLNAKVASCTFCGYFAQMAEKISKIKESRKTPSDDYLENCCRCKCRTAAIVHIKKEILNSCTTPENMLQYPQWCWKRFENETAEEAKEKLHI